MVRHDTSTPHRAGLPALLLAACAGAAPAQTPSTLRLSALELDKVQQDWGQPRADVSVDGHPLTIAGRKFEHGLGTHANSSFAIDLRGGARALTAWVGLDDEVGAGRGSIEFRVVGDKRELWRSGVLRAGDAAKELRVPLEGVKTLRLLVDDGGDDINYDHADWAEAVLEFTGAAPVALEVPREPAVVLTPRPGPAPRINGAKVVGARPGRPFLYRIPATGERPMVFDAEGLPAGLALDPATGIVTGSLAERGTHVVKLRAVGARGTAERELRVVCGDQIALTPPLGWNSWNCFACAVDDGKVRGAADALVASGLLEHGWTYVNIDDCWEAGRDERGVIQSNAKFPDMKALGDYLHSLGLKFGIYSSPGPQTCAGYEGSWQHETQDAERYAQWGVDYLKYDWCSYGGLAKDQSLPELMKPYRTMRAALDAVDRDIVYSLCQYGMGDVSSWGAEVGGNCWRTTGDITDTWSSLAGIGFAQAGHERFAGPGHWNDPDMLVVGKVGWGNLHPTRLTPNEQYTHISLWCLLAAPLLIGCDMAQLDEFTLGLLTNDEVLEVDQDPLGAQAARVARDGEREVWAKELEDGSLAVGLFNRGSEEARVTARWSDLGLEGPRRVRDLWRQQELAVAERELSADVPRHGVVLVRISPARAR